MHVTNTLRLTLCFLLSFTILGCGENIPNQRPEAGPAHVDVLKLTPTTLRLTTELPGRITAFKQAEVRPQVTGILKSRLYVEGSQVETGDVLYQIDPTVYQSNVNSAQAQLAKALTSQETARKTAIRYQELLKKKLTSQQLYDDADAAYKEAQAEVAIRQAALDYANIELSYTQIKAPISGQVGLSQVSEGSLLTAEQSSYLTTIIQTSNVYVDMQQSSLSIHKLKQDFSDFKDKREEIPVSITLEDGSAYEQIGHLEFADTQVSGSTGTVTLRAIIPNSNNTLLAGMYVRAHISMPEARDYLVVPQSAVVRSQSGEPSVFVVGLDNKTVKKSVELGNEVGNGWVVKQGLASGDLVVINNILNMRNNIDVVVDSTSLSTQLDVQG
ncbi:efflux RND transporter periplasmic adaptor subunit [Agarivorans albus]|uniref:Acriflavin resistance protein A n=1 Tax=Agarivorans albus MKT 106 TaxID=1331007 RepID=R9PK04_AGAAL|nr:efflux RND transporter periplasmic adaptor subunit [Agarivorans albus]GAD01709.1 acriflavin resistance protein A [Agarivorans albus MKT 106]